MKENYTQKIFIENNGIGLAAVAPIRNNLTQHQEMRAYPENKNKEIRILSNYEFVKKYFIFNKEKAETDPEYKEFIKDLTTYSKEGDNTHKKDAIDVLCTAASILKIKYKKILFG